MICSLALDITICLLMKLLAQDQAVRQQSTNFVITLSFAFQLLSNYFTGRANFSIIQ